MGCGQVDVRKRGSHCFVCCGKRSDTDLFSPPVGLNHLSPFFGGKEEGESRGKSGAATAQPLCILPLGISPGDALGRQGRWLLPRVCSRHRGSLEKCKRIGCLFQ